MSKIRKTVIISGAPGIGKSHFFSKAEEMGLSATDSDSINFSWSSPGVRNPDFPRNYIEHLKTLMGKVDVICVSTHEQVRNCMEKEEMEFVLVYPEKGQKEEYLRRFKERDMKDGETKEAREKFVKLMEDNWENWIDEQLPKQKGCTHLVLKGKEYLSDRIKDILK